MDENKFQIIDADSISLPARRRKTKQKPTDPAITAIRVQQIKEDDYWKQESRMLLAYARLNERKQLLKSGVYDEDKNPYAHLVDPRHKYEIEMEEVFHCDPDADFVSDCKEVTASVMEEISEICDALFGEYSLTADGSGFDVLQNLYDRIDQNKDRITDLLLKEEAYNARLADLQFDMIELQKSVGDMILELGGWCK